MLMSVPTHTKALDLAYIALMAALIALCAWISVPLGPVPFTMQTFGIFAALGLLGGRRGTLAFLIYLLLGIVGLPVFSGFSAGAGYCSAPRADICWAIWPPRSSSGASPPSWGKPFR